MSAAACSLIVWLLVSKFSHFSSPHPPFIVLSPLLFIYKFIAVMISIDTSWEWIAMYGPVQYSTVQYSTVQYITTVIIDNSGHGHRSQVTVTVTGYFIRMILANNLIVWTISHQSQDHIPPVTDITTIFLQTKDISIKMSSFIIQWHTHQSPSCRLAYIGPLPRVSTED